MKKILIYIFILILMCFSLPIIFTAEFSDRLQNTDSAALTNEITEEGNVSNTTEQKTESTYDYAKYSNIKLLHKDSEEIETIPLDEYLYGVVSAEMPASFEEEALKAQAVVARTYTIYKIVNNDGKHEGADICDDSTCCQAWISEKDRKEKWKDSESETNWQKIVNAVNGTQGKIITYEGEPINAFFHSNSGGETEAPIDVWGRKRLSLSSVCCNCRRRYI